MEYGKAMTIYLSSLAADCFPARDCGPSVSMVITDRPRHYCVSSSQSIYYKLMYRKVKVIYFPEHILGALPGRWICSQSS